MATTPDAALKGPKKNAVVFAAFFFGPFNAASGVVAIEILELMHIGAAAPILWSVQRLRPAA